MPRYSRKRQSIESVESKSPLTPVLPDGQFENAQIKVEHMENQYAAAQEVSSRKVNTPIILSQPAPRRYREDDFDFSHLAPQNPRLDQDLRIDGQPKRPANSFLLFSRWRRENPGNDFDHIPKPEWSSAIGFEWNHMGEERKSVWTHHYNRLRNEFDALYPDYKFTRVPNRPRSGSNRSIETKARASPVGGVGPVRPVISRANRSASTSHGSLSLLASARRSSDTQLPSQGYLSNQPYMPQRAGFHQPYPMRFDPRPRHPSEQQSPNLNEPYDPVCLHPNNAYYPQSYQPEPSSPTVETSGNGYYGMEGPWSRAEGNSPSHLSAQLEGFRFPGFSEEDDSGPYSAPAVVVNNPISRPASVNSSIHSGHSDGTCNPSELSLNSQ